MRTLSRIFSVFSPKAVSAGLENDQLAYGELMMFVISSSLQI